MRLVKRAWWVVGLLVLGGVGGAYVWGRGDTAQAETTGQLVTVSRGSLTASISPTGEVEAAHRVALGFDVNRVALVEVYVAAGQQVAAGEPLARVDEEPLRRALDQAKADALSLAQALEQAANPYTEEDAGQASLAVAQAEAALQEAQGALEDVQSSGLADAQAAVQSASRRLEQARTSLASIDSSTATQEQIDALRWRYNEAEAFHGGLLQQTHVTEEGFDKQQAAYNKMMDAKDSLETAQARAALNLLTARHNVTSAETALAQAHRKLASLQGEGGALAVAQAQNRVAQADLDLARAQERLATVQAGPREEDILLAQARYDAALATLAEAQDTLENATLLAPFDGTVISVPAATGDLLTASSTVVILADLTDLRVLVTVDETDISQVAVGQQVTITFDALPGKRFTGEVLAVPLEGTLSQNVVTYRVPVSLAGAEGAGLLPGMTANVTIVTGRSDDALLVPILALGQDDEGYYVQVEDGLGGSSVARVEVGLGNGQYVEITRGLLEGDRVLVQLQQDSASTQMFGAFGGGSMGMPGAIAPGGGQGPVVGGMR